MLDRRRMLAAAVAAMTCPLGGVLALAQPAAPSGPSLVVPAPRALAALPVRAHHVTVRQCHRHVTRSARHLRVDLTAGIGREVDGGGMAGGGSGCPGDGAESAIRVWPRRNVTAALRFERPSGCSFSLGRRRGCPPAPGRDALLKGSVLGLPGAIDEKPADQACTRSGGRTEPGVPADGAKNGADPGARNGAGQRPLLGRGHICAGSERHSEGRE